MATHCQRGSYSESLRTTHGLGWVFGEIECQVCFQSFKRWNQCWYECEIFSQRVFSGCRRWRGEKKISDESNKDVYSWA